MIDLALNGGVPVVCALLSALILATRIWHPRYTRAYRNYSRRIR